MALSADELQSMFGKGAAGGLIGSGAYGLFGGNKNPADAANPYLNQISGQANPYLQPYFQYGQSSLPQLQNQYNDIFSGKKLSDIGANYKQSPGFKFAMEQALKGAGSSASAAGLTGTPAASQNTMNVATGLASQDYNNYMNQALGLYGQGLTGEQGMSQQGLEAGQSMADIISQQLAAQAQNAYEGQAQKNQSNPWANIGAGLGLASQFIPFGGVAKGLFDWIGGKH